MALVEHLEKLRHFYKITQYKSINEASQKTGFSQAGLSKSLQLLETELGCKLFKRSREGLSLTKEGIEVKAFAQTLIESSAGLEQRLRSLSAVQTPKVLRIGMYDSIAIYFGFELNEYLRQVYPDVKLEITADSSSSLFKSIRDFSLDLAIGVNFHKVDEKSLKYYKLFEDNYALYSTSKKVTDDIENSIIIHDKVTDENGISINEMFNRELKGKRIHKVSNFETLKQLVVVGLGIGVLPTLVARPLLQSGQIVPYDLGTSKKLRGKHSIGILAQVGTVSSYKEFVSDIIRLGDRWIKT